jgi:hypothetical protein
VTGTVQPAMRRVVLVLLTAALLTSACEVLDDDVACGCTPPPTKKAAEVAATFAGLVEHGDGEAAWRLLTDGARRHYRDEPRFARELPKLAAERGGAAGGGQRAANWKTIGVTGPRQGHYPGELVLPVLAGREATTVGRVALPIDGGPDPMTANDRVGVPVAADLAVRAPAPGATVRAVRPAFTVVVPDGDAATVVLIPGTDSTGWPTLEQVTADAVRAAGRKTPTGHAYTWQPDFDPPPGRYVLAAAARPDGRWSWNAVLVTVAP